MTSKKKKSKGRGKSKRAAKKVEQCIQGTLDTQMDRLKINEDCQTNADEEAFLEEAIKRAAAEKEALDAETAEREKDLMRKSVAANDSNGCYHGYVKIEAEDDVIALALADTFMAAFGRAGGAGVHGNFRLNLRAATEAVIKEYSCVWFDPAKLRQVVSLIVFNGTQAVLEGELHKAQFLSAIACYFEDVAAIFSGEKDRLGLAKFSELFFCDEHTLVTYLRKRIPCSCLDEKYKEVKSITKTGTCCNPLCSLPDRFRVERSKMLSCARCGDANYCSRECQKVDWQRHKEPCDEAVNWKTFGNLEIA